MGWGAKGRDWVWGWGGERWEWVEVVRGGSG